MALRTSADNAEDVAAGFRMLRDPLPEHATEITSLIADLYSISTSLTSLDDLTKNRQFRRNVAVAKEDLDLVQTSLKYTLEDIVDFFGDIEVQKGSNREVFKRTWLSLTAFFQKESHEPLPTRLAKYKTFLRELEDLIKDKFPDTSLMSGLRNNFKGLLIQQENRLTPRFGGLSLGTPSSSTTSAEPGSPVSDRRPRNRRSYERARPSHRSPQSPLSPSSGTFSDIPPSAPDAPGSPTTTSTTTTSQSAASNTLVSDHWAKRVFLDEITMTPIPYVGESSKCLGDHSPGVKRWLKDEGFEELFQLAFTGDSDLRVHFYLREDDHRARILCKAPHTTRPSEYFCMPLNLLEIVRVGSCLNLCRRRRGGYELVLWANFKFSTIEQMVLFFCTFLALRSQDAGRPVESIRDYELDNEEELFGGQILDDNYLHALRIYRDKVSGAVRLQASVHKGEMKRAPVWTAFITQYLGTRSWIRRPDSKVVVLRELRQTIFMFAADYTPQKTSRGDHILQFTNRADAQGFVETIAELANTR
ncbi:hypothetical protein IFM51744_07178 [Aspergillus udagawae]|uniref:Uncharacterized protein n=1 Tax=Aspergillus udagawae TaxID=91492 RepID=A0A8H3PEQ8_9EURO|nr:uncharacterized protein Aud_003451 [Aspergillus udagawae]GFF49808.1 hypothetical protein IFM51744_07178 [Aspergillus udagawae]GIC87070.1 hypothetical protein Aud_003451 [Aspergillus udagawae]